ncbi:sigma-70 family RNA polymerase sigma factor [Natranaerobius thermophilus]|uniref:RNA polymerase sigma factor n=1 Tax=Natranaerobius thermophilus (strain ATCC BAA-1301 / DSM 18059 / JW/NM-WN-LF) TaxID=457570 RepID=B2A375_NATTJ|nr:FliA/WhiG family RNA polymerase sigma factor [Natranaerobius thermophilus]ACB85005.1 RNA polymerase, sigma 28 subunit, FliA/WhiG [Natranaerobius thermophilus JW/NM-WN-LF]
MSLNLITSYQDSGDRQQLEKLISEYSYLVKKQVDKVNYPSISGLNRDDLISFGVIGLIDAIKKFDINRNVPFEAYANIRIRGAILDGLRKFDFVPRNLREEMKTLHSEYRKLEQKLGRTPTNNELAYQMSISEAELDKLWQATNCVIPSYLSDYITAEEGELTLEDIYPDSNSPDPQSRIDEKTTKQELGQAIDTLPQKEKLVLSLYYYEELTLKEIAKILELTESRISQLHSKAVLRLRGKLAKKKLDL